MSTSKPFYVLKDKEISCLYITNADTYGGSLRNARRFNTVDDARQACSLGEVKGGPSLLTGGLRLVKVTETTEDEYREIAPGVSLPVGAALFYVIRDMQGFYWKSKGNGDGVWVENIKDATEYSTQAGAVTTLGQRAIRIAAAYEMVEIAAIAKTTKPDPVYKEEDVTV